VLDREEPPLVWVVLRENVLTFEVGGPAVMHAQLIRLAELAARPRVTVQLLASGDVHVGLHGSVGIAETPDACVVYLEDFADGCTTDSPVKVAVASERFETLRSDAYRRTESLHMIESAAEQCKP
jgi:hypothetical protein